MNINTAFVINMNINATLIIQAINFFIAYLLFRFILLKPAYAAICEEQDMKASLEQLIVDDKRVIEYHHHHIAEQWSESYIFFKKNLPMPIDHIYFFKGMVPKISLQPIDKMLSPQIKHHLTQAIVAAVEGQHDRR